MRHWYIYFSSPYFKNRFCFELYRYLFLVTITPHYYNPIDKPDGAYMNIISARFCADKFESDFKYALHMKMYLMYILHYIVLIVIDCNGPSTTWLCFIKY